MTKPTKRVRVYHAYYGCETGCCGHVVEINGESQGFDFAHPHGADHVEWARRLVEQVVGPECLDTIDWSTLDVEDVRTD